MCFSVGWSIRSTAMTVGEEAREVEVTRPEERSPPYSSSLTSREDGGSLSSLCSVSDCGSLEALLETCIQKPPRVLSSCLKARAAPLSARRFLVPFSVAHWIRWYVSAVLFSLQRQCRDCASQDVGYSRHYHRIIARAPSGPTICARLYFVALYSGGGTELMRVGGLYDAEMLCMQRWLDPGASQHPVSP